MAKHKFGINEKEYEVEVGARQGNRVQVTVNGKAYDVELKSSAAAAPLPRPVSPSASFPPPPPPQGAAVATDAGGGEKVLAPMAGLVLAIKVKVGDQVSAGDELLSLEAMKMENAITAPCSGKVKRIAVEPNAVVDQDDVLIEIA